jgi:MFS family permease
VLAFLCALAIVTYLDRLCISIAGPRMQAELGFTPERWGWVVGVFAISYGAFEIPAGALGDRIGHRGVLTRIVVWWSAFTGLTSATSSFSSLLVVRFLFGAGEAGAFPNISGALSRWFPATERARAQGLVWGASRVGGVISPLLAVPIMRRFGWRATFRFFGGIGLVWAAAWFWWYRNRPSQQLGITQRELGEIGSGNEAPSHTAIPWGQLARARQLWIVMLMYSFYGWGSYFYLSWLHTYLVKGRGLSEREMGIFSTLPFILGAGANIVGGFLSDHVAKRYGLKRGRRLLGCSGLGLSAIFVLATALTTGKASGVIFVSLGYGAMDLMLPSAWAICLDLGGQYAGAVSGAMNSSGHVGGFLSSVLFGYLVRDFGNYDIPLFVIATMLMVSAFLFSRIDPTKPIVIEEAR